MKITPTINKAILLFSQGVKNIDIAKELDVSPETISKWKNDYSVQAEINKILNANSRAVSEQLRSLSTKALTTITEILDDKEAPHRDRLTAAYKILELNRVSQSPIGAESEQELEQQAVEEKALDAYGI